MAYTLGEKDTITFTHTDGAGKTKTETHTRRPAKIGMIPLGSIAVTVALLAVATYRRVRSCGTGLRAGD